MTWRCSAYAVTKMKGVFLNLASARRRFRRSRPVQLGMFQSEMIKPIGGLEALIIIPGKRAVGCLLEVSEDNITI